MNEYQFVQSFCASQEKPNYTQIAFAFQEAELSLAGRHRDADSIAQVRRKMEISYNLPSFDEWRKVK